jgi:hypothetical protein
VAQDLRQLQDSGARGPFLTSPLAPRGKLHP